MLEVYYDSIRGYYFVHEKDKHGPALFVTKDQGLVQYFLANWRA